MIPLFSERARAFFSGVFHPTQIQFVDLKWSRLSYQLLALVLTYALLLQLVPRVASARTSPPVRSSKEAQTVPSRTSSFTPELIDGGVEGVPNNVLSAMSGNDVSTFPGIVGLDSVTISASSAYVDSFDSLFAYADSHGSHANVFSNGKIDLKGAKVYGNVVSSQGNVVLESGSLVSGDLTYATTLTNSGTVQGTISRQTTSPFTAAVPAACGSYRTAPTSSNNWVTGDFTYDQTRGDLTVSGGHAATLANGTYCLHNVTLSGGSTLTVNGAVVINLTGQLNASGGSFANTTNRPANLQISTSYTGNNGVTLSGGTNAYLKVLAPGTSITLSGGSPIFGALVGKTLTVSGNSVIHYDTRQPDTTPPRVAIISPVDNSTTTSASVALSGTASDNGSNDTGLANITVNGTAASYDPATGTWSLTSIDLVLGSNTITAVATDNTGNQSSTQITVTRQPPPNQPPTVSAGQNQTITLPATASLNGSASDDDLPVGTLTTIWSQVSGPGTVSFGDPNVTVTTAAFSMSGTYLLRLTATDSQLSSSSDVTVIVIPQNQAPAVNAGADQAITLPNVASLNGSVSDDGLPSGVSVSTQWITISGPGTVTFANPNAPVTTASFSVSGTYVLRLSASDSQLSASDDVSINVIAQNHAPTADAGADQSITLPSTASLNGTISDDGLPSGSTLTSSWTQVTGPGTVTFLNPNSAATLASFTTAGDYVLRLTASDSQLTASDEITITVIAENHAPTVNAGADQTIALPSMATLNGSVSDDGLPAGSIVTTSWTKVSGPGEVVFATPNNTLTTTSFSAAGTYVLRLTASDSQLATSDDLVVVVDPENQAPNVNAGADQTVTLPSAANLNAVVTDDSWPRGSSVSVIWSKVSGPGTVTFDNPNSVLTTASFSAAGTYVLQLTASDSQLSASDDLVVTVISENHAPTANAGADQQITLPNLANLNGSVSDDGLPSGSSLSSAWSKVRGPGTVTFANPNVTVTTAAFSEAGTYVLRLTVNDSQLTASDDLQIIVIPENHAPTVSAGADQEITLPGTASLNGSAVDDGLPSGSTLNSTWSKVSGPGTVTFAAPNNPVTTASFSVAGVYVLHLTASDSELSASDDLVVTVIPENHAPTTNAGPDQQITLPNVASLNGSVSDDGLPAGGNLTSVWAKVSGPGVVTFSNANAAVTSAAFSEAGTYVLRLTADDSQLSSSDDIVITVIPENHAPSVSAGADQEITLPAVASLSGTAVDDGLPSGSTLNITWSKVSGPGTVTFGAANNTSTTASFSVAGTYVLRLTASDSQLSSSDDIVVTVIPENHAPAANAGPDQQITLPNVANLNGSVSDDGLPAGSTLSSIWNKVSGPGAVTFGNPNVTVTTATFSVAGTYVLRLTANDSQLSASDDVQIVVIAQNFAPTVNAGADQTITFPANASLNGSVSDDGLPSGSSIAITWSKVSGPGIVTFANASVTVTTAAFDQPGAYVLRLTASDSDLTTSDDLTVTVIDPRVPPVANFVVPESTGTAGAFVIASSGFTGSAFSADKLLDDNNGTFWNAPAATNQFATMQFFDQQNVYIDRVRLQSNQGSVNVSTVKDFEVQISSTTSDPSSFVAVLTATLLNNGQLQEFVFPGGPIRAKYLKFLAKNNYQGAGTITLGTFNPVAVGSADNLLSLPGLANVARSQSPAMIFNGAAIYSASYGSGLNNADGLLGYARGGFVTTTKTNEFAIIQLGGNQARNVSGIRIATWYDIGYGSATAVKDFEVWVSPTTLDPSSFTKVLTASTQFVGNVQTFMFPGGPVPARYIKYVPLSTHGTGTTINTAAFDVITDSGARVIAYSSENQNSPLPPEAAFDGDTNTQWGSQQGVVTNVWVKVALADDKIQKVYGFRIYPSNTVSFLQGPKDIEIRVSTTTTDDSAFTTVYTGTLPGAFSNGPQEIFLPNMIDARYVQFFWKNGYYAGLIAVRELEVLAAPDRGSGVVAFSNGAGNVEAALDLDPTNVPWQTPLNQNTNASFTLVMPRVEVQTFSHVALRPAISSNGTYFAPKDFQLQVSTTDAADSSFTTVFSGTLVNSVQLQDFYFAPLQAKYVRLVIVKGPNDFSSFALHNFIIYALDTIGTTTRFLDRSTDSDGQVVSWAWNFGDGATSAVKNPTHAFPQAGDYTVSLTVTDNSGLTHTYSKPYHVIDSINTDFAISPMIAHEGGESVRFTDLAELLTIAGGQRRYDFGDGSALFTQNAKNVVHTYNDSGVFHVKLSVDDVLGVSHSITKDITVLNLPPTVDIDPGKTLVWGESWTSVPRISDQSPVDQLSLQGQWTFADGQTSNCTNCNNANATVTHAYAHPGSYHAVLTVTDKDGGVGSDSADFVINKRPTKFVFQNPPNQTDGQLLIIHAQLIDTFANLPLSGKPVQFTLNGAPFNAVTGANGVAEASVPLPAGTKIDIITGSFAEDEFYLSCGGATVPLTAGGAPPNGTLGSQGTNFWLMFPHAFFDGNLAVQRLYISSRVDTTGTVTIPGGGFNFTQNFTVQANTITTIQLPFVQVYESNIVQAKGIHVTSQQPVTVYGLNQRVFTSDAFLALPVNTLGTDHLILTYSNMGFSPTSEFGIVASENSTTVTITPAVTTGTRIGGVPYNITLNQGQTYLLQNTVPTTAGDLTGSRVTSDKPIAVFGGHAAATIPAEAGCCADHLVEQMTPINVWGKRFATMPIATRTKGDFFRFIASQDGTNIYLNGNLVAMLNRGQWVEKIIKDPTEIIATNPIMVAQYATSVFYDPPTTGKADPFEMIIPPYSQFLNHYTVSTPGTGFAINYANVVAPSASLGSITLDGNPIPAGSFTPIGVSGYSGAQVPIAAGMHNLDGPASFGVFVYGFNQDEGYGYPGGMNMSPSVQTVNIAVTPESSDHPINSSACLLATVTNQDQFPLGGRTIAFNVTGANPANFSATTDAAGQAMFCYTGTNLGSDSVRATVGSTTGTASVQWRAAVPNQAPTVNAGPDQAITMPAPASLQGLATDDGLPANILNVSWSRVSGPGNVTFANAAAALTTATFDAAGTYVLRLTASDTDLSASDDVQIIVNPVPTNHSPTADAGPDQSAAIKGNLIINPGADQALVNGEIPGWVEELGTTWTQGNSSTAGLPAPQLGNSFFYVGADGAQNAELRQDVDVSAFANTIAAGTQQFEFQSWLMSGTEFPYPDNPRVIFEFRNAQNNTVLGTYDTSTPYVIGSWHLIEGIQAAPIGTGWIRVRLIATRNQGPYNDSYFDSISLRPVGNTAVKLNGTVSDDGLPYGSSVSANWTAVSGPAPVTFTNANAATSAASFTAAGAYVLRLTASDGQLTTTDDVTVTINPQNHAPTVAAGTQQTITLPATAPLNGTVNDDGLPVGSTLSVHWTKDQGPGIVTFANPNAASTTASFSTPGSYILLLTADDSEYSANTPFYVTVNPTPVNQAPTVSAGADQTISLPTDTTTLNGSVADDGNPAGSSLSVIWTKISGPGNVVFGTPNAAVTTAQFSATGTYVLRLTANDGALSTSDDVNVTVTPANQAPTVNAGSDQTTILSAGAQLNGSASDDGYPVGGPLTTTWSKVSGPGIVTFLNPNAAITGANFSATGTYVLRLTASDTALTSSDDVTVIVNDNVPGPTVQITAPSDDASVTEPTMVTGSVSGGDWKLEYSLDSDDNANNRFWTTFASGTGAASGTLGTIDPTMMLNGLFDIRLSATDQYGQTSRTNINVIVERNLKVGNFTVSFTDLSIPVAGVPMEVTRTYDSRDKRVGDFGFGWTLGLNNIRVEKSSVVGLKWYETVSQEVFPNYCLEPVGSHAVTVTFPGGKVFKFQPSVAPHCQRNAPITAGTLSFTPMPGTVGKLEVVGSSDVQIDGSVPGPVNLIGFGGGVDIFNSFIFKFTAEDGTAYVIDQRTGLQSLADPNGNTLTIGAGGIVHSSGKSIVFNRDIVGRITSIVDPNGNSQFYNYDPNGDLVSYTDNANNTSTYTYDANHRLLTIHDPRGIQPIRNDYDPSGRLISHTDGFGKVITYLHDIPNRTETVTDRLGHPTVFEYDERGNVLRTTDARGGVTSFTYDANDNVLTETNALGKTTTYTYDANNHPLTVTDPLGHLIQFTYNALGRVLTMTDPLGHVTTNTYNTAGNLLTSEDSLHNITSFTYSVFGGQLAGTTDALNHTTQFEYTSGRLTKKTDALGNVTTFTYDTNGSRASDSVKRTNAQGQLETITTSYEYDKLNRLKKTTFADSSFSQVEYNSIGKQSATIDQLGHRTEFTYDDMGRLIKTTYPDGTHEDTTYDAEGRKLTNTDRAGHVTSCVYDELGRVTKVTFADGTFTQTGYDAAGQVLTTSDARGNITRFFYDDSGRRTKARNALSQETTFTYDDNGDQLTITDALSHTLTYEYDLNNRRTKTIYNDSTFDSVAYDAVGRTVSKTDQAGKSTLFIYDLVGRLTKVKDALNQETAYGYDELGQQTSRTDANNHITRFDYDQLGRRVKRILPGGQFETYAYDIGGNLASKTNFNGKTTTFAYDTMRRLLSRTPDASLNQAAISFTYNAAGQRATMSDSSGVTTYAYDVRNRISSKQTPFGTLTYTYDEAGSLLTTRSSNANGVSVDYSYDALNRLSTVKDNNLTPLNGGLTNYVYDSVGNLQSYTYPNGVTTSYAYNSLNRLTTMTAGTPVSSLVSYSYTLGATGNRTAVTELGGRSVSYTYDDLYRLTNESIANDPHGVNGSASYSYDAVGNRLSRTSTIAPVPSQSSTYDANDRLNSDTYDNNGNTKTANGNSYVYDFENHLTSLNGGNVTYVYDGDGNRVSRTVSGVTTNYLVDANNPTGYAQVVDELQSGAVVRSYAYGHALISQRIVGGAASFFQYDGQGSVRQLTDAAAAVTDAYDYDAFGNLLHVSGSTPNEHLYSGEQFDANLGFYNLRARLMNPTTGRFMTMDSFEGVQSDPRSLHKYLYGFANPVTNADPSGNTSLGELAITVGVGAVISSMATFALNILTGSTAVANAEENFSFDGFLVSGRLTESGYGGTVEGGLDVVYDIKKGQVFVALAAELGTAPVSIFKTRRGADYSLFGGFVIGMHDPSELSGRGTSAVEPLALWALQSDVGLGGGRGKAWSLLMHLAKRVKNRLGYSATVGVSASGPAYFQIARGTFFSSTVTEDGPFVPITDVPEDMREYAVALGELTSSLARKIHDAAGLYENGDAFLLELQGFNY